MRCIQENAFQIVVCKMSICVGLSVLIWFVPVTLYGDIDLDQHWLRQWLDAPSHYLNLCWLDIRKCANIRKMSSENTAVKIHPHLPWANEFTSQHKAHDDLIKWKHFPCYWPFVRGISPHKGRWRGALIFSLMCAWINGWVSNREASDLRRHRAHYNVTVMKMADEIIDWHFTHLPPTISQKHRSSLVAHWRSSWRVV